MSSAIRPNVPFGRPLPFTGFQFFPPSMLAIAHATPHYWAISAWQSLVIDGKGLDAIIGRLAVLVGFGIVLTAIAAVALRRDLTRG